MQISNLEGAMTNGGTLQMILISVITIIKLISNYMNAIQMFRITLRLSKINKCKYKFYNFIIEYILKNLYIIDVKLCIYTILSSE